MRRNSSSVGAWHALAWFAATQIASADEYSSRVYPGDQWATATLSQAGMARSLLEEARDYALSGGGSGLVIRDGRLVFSWGDPDTLYDLKSTTKSIGITALGLALQDGLVTLDDAAQSNLPSVGVPPESNVASGWLESITIRQLATHSAGFAKRGGFPALVFEPASRWAYSDGGANWLADVLTVRFGTDLREVMTQRVFEPLGIGSADLEWRDHRYRDNYLNGVKRREFGSGVSASVNAMSRLGYLYLREGQWEGKRLLPRLFVERVGRPDSTLAGLPIHDAVEFPAASAHYGLLWWNNGDGALARVPRDAFWAWGLGDSLVVVVPSLDLVVARAGGGWRTGWNADYGVLQPFLEPIVLSLDHGDPGREGRSVAEAGSRRDDAGADPAVSLPATTLPIGTHTTGAPASGAVAESLADEIDHAVDAIGGPEVVKAGPDRRLALPANTVSLAGSVDTGAFAGDPVVNWSLVSGPGRVSFSELSEQRTEVTLSAAGVYRLLLTASDGDNSASDEVTVVLQEPPYPQSRVITGIQWAPVSEVIRAAEGSDNWPLTWGADGDLYTAYGDGVGFSPGRDEKLSLGYARVSGLPPDFVGRNIPSESGEQLGARHRGKKSSGMLMVARILYQWVRNADEDGEGCQLAVSRDRAKRWAWQDWQFDEFGYCAFLNFGRNYAGARDRYVYMYASDTPSAYHATDGLVLSRVRRNRITDGDAYEFFSGSDARGEPTWSEDIDDRQPVFVFPGGVNRFDVTWNAPLARYLLTMRSGGLEQTDSVDHFSIFEGPEPWGPWANVYYDAGREGGTSPAGIDDWGESQHIPAKWISADGRSLYLVFSGGDSFAVRHAMLEVAQGSSAGTAEQP